MKKAITASLFTLIISTNVFANIDFEKQVNQNIEVLTAILQDYDLECGEYNINFDYHVGFLNGRLNAYKECLLLMKESKQ